MKTRIASLITLGVVAVLAIVVMVLYLVPVTYMPQLSKPSSVEIYQTSSKNGTFLVEDKQYTEVVNAFNQSFSQPLLSAIFAGQTSGAFNQTASGELLTTTTAPSYSTYVQFSYNEGQKIVVNGHEQVTAIDRVIVQVENTVGYSEVKVYFRQILSGPGATVTYYYMNTLATQAELYKLITSYELV